MATADPWAEFKPYAPPSQSEADPWADFKPYQPQQERSPPMDAAIDVAKAIPSGAAKGVAGVVGLPGAAQSGVDWVAKNLPRVWGGQPISDEEAARRQAQVRAPQIGAGDVLTPQNVQGAIEGVTGPLYEPHTTAGQFAGRAAEFVPGALLGPGAGLRTAITYGVAPGLASEAAGQATAGTPYESAARIGGALATGGAGAFLTRPSSAGAMVSRAAEGMTPQQIEATERLFQEAQQVGIPLTRAEAAQAATNGATRLADLQRVVEGNGGLKPFMAERPQQVQTAGNQAVEGLANTPQNPSTIGPAVGRAAEQTVADQTAAINARTRPLYQAAEQQRVGAPVANALQGDPIYARALEEIRNDPTLNRTIANLPNDSPGVIDLVQRRIREQAENARIPGQASTSNLRAANLEDARIAPIAAAETATGSQAAGPNNLRTIGSYEAARMAQENLRRQHLEPLTSGPIGRLARSDISTQQAIEALFPRNPLPNSAGEVLDAVTNLSQRNPWAASQLVRAHVESVFDQATRNLQSGPSQFGGATFAAAIRGNQQQAANLAASIRGLYGPQTLNGFDRLLRVMEATGQRQRIGSQTAFNQEANKAFSQGGTTQAAIADIASLGTHVPARFRDTLKQWNMGRNTEEIAHILTNPQGAEAFRQLASAPASSAKAGALVGRLVALGSQSSRDKRQQQ